MNEIFNEDMIRRSVSSSGDELTLELFHKVLAADGTFSPSPLIPVSQEMRYKSASQINAETRAKVLAALKNSQVLANRIKTTRDPDGNLVEYTGEFANGTAKLVDTGVDLARPGTKDRSVALSPTAPFIDTRSRLQRGIDWIRGRR